jgi:hypothetical protein
VFHRWIIWWWLVGVGVEHLLVAVVEQVVLELGQP